MTEYTLVAVPDVFLPGGEIRHWTPDHTILRDRRRAIWEEARHIGEIVSTEGRSLTAAEARRWNQLMAEIAVIDGRLAHF